MNTELLSPLENKINIINSKTKIENIIKMNVRNFLGLKKYIGIKNKHDSLVSRASIEKIENKMKESFKKK